MKKTLLAIGLIIFIVCGMFTYNKFENNNSKDKFFYMSESEVASIYKDIKIGSNIKTVKKVLGDYTAVTESGSKYIWMTIDYGHKYVEVVVDKNGTILNKRTELDINEPIK